MLKLKQTFQKNKAVTAKLHSLWSVHFVVATLFVLTLASVRAVLNGNDVFSILMVSTKHRYFSFLKKVFVFQKIWIKVNVLKTFKTFTDCHIKTCRYGGLFWKSLVPFFRRIYALSVGFKMKSLIKSVCEC